ncbi:hypothetical protein D0N36_02095 [Hymenobacter lapidiphilus]|uniref:hypothetical protein n=1 Tax=Hymenobacter sp. CCM 8763 TaxID=2303334 RepID=UPI000E34B1C7|nr:hypothetical protein [Hymenobacter sp. CCM 8763]RFP66896.1 hypothetical protein D0N36_02095 [Hymenobacter sp. CCM 8763]
MHFKPFSGFRLCCVLVGNWLLAGCAAPEAAPPAAPAARDSYVVLLDLSDRLLVPGQPARDTALLGQVCQAFLAGAARRHYAGSEDRLRVVVAEQASHPAAVQALAQAPELFVDLGALPLTERRHAPARVAALRQRVAALYAAAAQGRRPADYAGAELWHYLAERLPYDFPAPDSAHADRRHLLVLTDGYLDFEQYAGRRQQGHRYASTRFVAALAKQGPEWPGAWQKGNYGLLPLPIRPALVGVRTLVAEVQPHADYHLDILGRTWQQWFIESGLPAPRILARVALPTAREQVATFLAAE